MGRSGRRRGRRRRRESPLSLSGRRKRKGGTDEGLGEKQANEYEMRERRRKETRKEVGPGKSEEGEQVENQRRGANML